MSKEEQKSIEEQREESLKRIRIVFADVFNNPNGISALRVIKSICGYDDNFMVFNPQTREINEKSVIYNAARREIYRELRQFLPKSVLEQVDYGTENEK